VHLIINGKDHDDLPEDLTVAGLIAHLGLPERKIAVERNMTTRHSQIMMSLKLSILSEVAKWPIQRLTR